MILHIKVVPQSRENGIVGFQGGVLKVRVQGTPVKGKVNDNLIEFLADSLGIAKSQIQIVAGLTNPRKKLAIVGVEEEAVLKWIKGN